MHRSVGRREIGDAEIFRSRRRDETARVGAVFAQIVDDEADFLAAIARLSRVGDEVGGRRTPDVASALHLSVAELVDVAAGDHRRTPIGKRVQ